MAMNLKQRGEIITLTATSAATAGKGYVEGRLFGIAAADAEIGEKVDIYMEGVWELDKDSADVFGVGDAVYYDTAAGVAKSHSDTDSNSAGESTVGPIGVTTASAGAGVSKVLVRLGVPATLV